VKHWVFGVVGHVDHGKTALVRALTGMETDRLPEEKRRGISIALGFAHLTAGDVVLDFIDMPGHERFVRTMVSGASGIDAALVVVAANEGVMPQTVEHLEIAGLLGLRRAVVAISKCDLVTAEAALAVAAEVAALLRRVGLAAGAAVRVSVVDGTGLEALRATLLAEISPVRGAEGVAFLPVDRCFSVPGHGTVVTGTLRGAAVAPGDTLALWPGERAVRVRGVQVHGGPSVRAVPGQRVALNLRDLALDEVRPGFALAAPGNLTGARWLSVALRSVADAPPLANAARLRALVGTAELGVRLRLLDRDVLEPGQSGLAQLHCDESVAVPAREKVILRLASPAQTVAGGVVIEPDTVRRRRRDQKTLGWLERLARLPPGEIVSAETERAGAAGTNLAHLARLSALPAARVAALLKQSGAFVGREGLVVQLASLEDLIGRVRRLVAGEARTREQLAEALPGSGRAVLDEALARLFAAGAVREEHGRIGERRVAAEQDRARAEAALRAELAETLRLGGLTPPDIEAVAERKRALDRLIREGVVVRAPDPAQKRVVLFHRSAIEEARRRLLPLLLRPPGLLVSEVGAALGISRKYSVPLLEHLDQIRFTRRVQDRRILAEAAG
jgi:selenocysteine-specific elongation factor